ncbi:unnamed protein product [Schistocephalus solidus]|uniref:Endo/exonuclease/phosphatase domain-containing protein n=1 Tax=Schistocephalus solidus TaxID=70667 RepID=A0A183SF88_SCHSO|nr:unnamed protein product [Schistocephalus solidus]
MNVNKPKWVISVSLPPWGGSGLSSHLRPLQPPAPSPTSGVLDSVMKPGSDNPRSNRLEQRTAQVIRELARYKVDIVALSETRLSVQGQLDANKVHKLGTPSSEEAISHLETNQSGQSEASCPTAPDVVNPIDAAGVSIYFLPPLGRRRLIVTADVFPLPPRRGANKIDSLPATLPFIACPKELE